MLIVRSAAGSRGFTLVEILVASALLVIFGAAAIAMLQGAVTMWRQHETMTDGYQRALDVLRQVQADLAQAVVPPSDAAAAVPALRFEPAPNGAAPQPRLPLGTMILGKDRAMRPFVAFTRHFADELGATPRLLPTADAGSVDNPYSSYWRPHVRATGPDPLRSFENLCEVAYCVSPFPRWRGITAEGTTFTGDWITGELVEELGVEIDGLDLSNGVFLIGRTLLPNTPQTVRQDSLEFVGHGLYRGYLAPPPVAWSPQAAGSMRPLTSRFEPAAALAMNRAYANEGWLGVRRLFAREYLEHLEWVADGVLYLMCEPADDRRSGQWYARSRPRAAAALLQTPRRVRITVTVEPLGAAPMRARLARDLRDADTELVLTEGFALPSADVGQPFLLIGDEDAGAYEWVAYQQVSGTTVRGLLRGRRHTVRHEDTFPRGTLVRWGVTLQATVLLSTGVFGDSREPHPRQRDSEQRSRSRPTPRPLWEPGDGSDTTRERGGRE